MKLPIDVQLPREVIFNSQFCPWQGRAAEVSLDLKLVQDLGNQWTLGSVPKMHDFLLAKFGQHIFPIDHDACGGRVAAIVPHHLACCLVTAASCAALWASIAAMCASMARWCATSAALMEERELLPDERGV